MILASFLLMFIFIGLICWKYGIPETISDSYYLTGEKPWFSIVMIVCGLLMIPKAILLSSSYWILGFSLFGILNLWMTGLFPKFRPKGYQRTLHLIGARVSGVVAQVCVILLGWPWIMLTWLLPIILFLNVWREKPEDLTVALDKVRFIFWVELVCFVNLYIGLLL